MGTKNDETTTMGRGHHRWNNGRTRSRRDAVEGGDVRASKEGDGDGHDGHDGHDDPRFAGAASRPQFRREKNKTKSNSRNEEDDDERGGSLLLASGDSGASAGGEEEVMDERFVATRDDPRFRVPGGSGGGGVDMYGRRRKKKGKKNESLKNRGENKKEGEGRRGFVTKEEGEEEVDDRFVLRDVDEDVDSDADTGADGGGRKTKGSASDEVVDVVDVDPEARIAYLTALSRGEVSNSSSSSEESSSESESESGSSDDEDEGAAEARGGMSKEEGEGEGEAVELTTEPSPYLAVTNVDWANVRAVDLFVILDSFTSSSSRPSGDGGSSPSMVKSVKVYVSDFGKERMEREARYGPSRDIFKKGGGKRKKGKKEESDDDSSSSSSSSGCGSDEDDVGDDGIPEEGDANPGEHYYRERDNDDASSDEDDDDEGLSDPLEAYRHFPHESEVRGGEEDRAAAYGDDVENIDDDFDAEALRRYEASKLKYYFAVVEFSSTDAADLAYRELDGMELEHSSSALDLRVVPPGDVQSVVKDRDLRDEAFCPPRNYVPKTDFVVDALQRTRVRCTWDEGDVERERALTTWAGVGLEENLSDDGGAALGRYLGSSDGDGSGGSDDDDDGGGKKGNDCRVKNMRRLLGLDDDGSDGAAGEKVTGGSGEDDDASSFSSSSSGSGGDDVLGASTLRRARSDKNAEKKGEGDVDKEMTYVPGAAGRLEDRIRSRLSSTAGGDGNDDDELTPWERYKLKRKEKRRERRKEARDRRKKRRRGGDDDDGEDEEEDDGMYGTDPEFGLAEFDDEGNDVEEGIGSSRGEGRLLGTAQAGMGAGSAAVRDVCEDDFFVLQSNDPSRAGKTDRRREKDASRGGPTTERKSAWESSPEGIDEAVRKSSTREELELLVAGDDDEENARNYDMRGLMRGHGDAAGGAKKGKRRRSKKKGGDVDAPLAAGGGGITDDFKIDATDDRFSALLDGEDARFGVDRTDPNFRDTPAMRDLLAEQRRRRSGKDRGGGSARKKKKGIASSGAEPTVAGGVVRDVDVNVALSGNSGEMLSSGGGGALALSSLVMSIKSNVKK